MFESGGSADDIRAQADEAVGALLADLSLSRVEENKWTAVRVHTAYDLLDARLYAEAQLDRVQPGAGDVVRACRAAESEAGTALGVSKTVAAALLDVGEALCHRLPLVDADFTAGLLNLSRVQVIVGVLSRASTDTVMAVESEVLAAAHRYTPRTLRTKIWEIWAAHDPDEADAARADADTASHKVYTRNTDDGAVELIARLSACSIAEVDVVLDQMIATVCGKDPRTPQQLRCAAFTAVFRHQLAIACECGRDDDCPVFLATADRRPPVSTVLNVYADLPTVLGLLDERPHLADGTPLDPQTAQWVRTNARIRGLLVELLDLAHEQFPDRFDTDDTPTPAAGHPAQPENEDESESEGAAAQNESPAPAPTSTAAPAPAPASTAAPTSRTPDHASRNRPRTSVRIVRRRTTSRPALDTPPPTGTTTIRRRPRPTTRERDVAAQIRDILARIDTDPTLTHGIDPTGHGTRDTPPPGALTYTPSTEVAACIRATYPTCVFPGCDVPAEHCELDHTVPFDHHNPRTGGWTVTGNLTPLCKNHHQAKTERSWTLAIVDHGFLCWTTRSGLIRITAPQTWAGPPKPVIHDRPPREKIWDTPKWEPPPDPPLPDDLFAPTWWENRWPYESPEPCPDFDLEAIARATHPGVKWTLMMYRSKKREHDRIVKARADAQPCPF